jgi:AbrB family looped-hinge helix DNA binding protein
MVSKITAKGQITLPKKVRDKLDVRAGDYLAYEVAGNTVKLRKAQPLDLPWLRALSRTLASEWDSSYDHENFDDL